MSCHISILYHILKTWLLKDNLKIKTVSYYEIVVYNDSVLGTAVVDSGTTTTEITVPAANYSVLVLAGELPYSGSTTAYLLGSGVTKGVSVTAESVTSVTVSLKNSTFSATYPDTVQCGNSYNISVGGNFGVDVLAMCFPYISIDGKYKYDSYPVSSKGTWSASYTQTAPLSPVEHSLNFMYSSELDLTDSDYSRNTRISPSNNFNKTWCHYKTDSNSNPYYDDLNKTISFVTTSSGSKTGLNVAIEWATK